VLWVLITVVGLVVGWGMMDGVVNGMVGHWGVVNNWGGMVNSMVGYNWGVVNSMVSHNWGSVDSMVNSWGSMVNSVSTEGCERNGGATSHQWDKSSKSKDLHDVVL